jgi:putative metallohydrolase (TIGR04338 family)
VGERNRLGTTAKEFSANLTRKTLQLFLPFGLEKAGKPAGSVRRKRVRDSQRSKIYASEKGLRRGQRFQDMRDCQRYVDLVVFSPWWQERFGSRARVEARDGRGRRHAGAFDHKRAIALPKWSRSELIILHELAHIATPLQFAAHGPEFARNYLELVRYFMGDRAAARLENGYRMNHVRVAQEIPD